MPARACPPARRLTSNRPDPWHWQAANCCAKLAEATTLRCTQAQTHCRRVLLSDFAAAVRQPAFTSLELAIFAEVLEADELICEREEVALLGLVTWWEAQAPKPDMAALDQLLPLIRWPLLSTECLSKGTPLPPRLNIAATQKLEEAPILRVAESDTPIRLRPCVRARAQSSTSTPRCRRALVYHSCSWRGSVISLPMRRARRPCAPETRTHTQRTPRAPRHSTTARGCQAARRS